MQPGSGAPAFYKGDVRKEGELRLECKTTSKRSYALKLDELNKIRTEAITGGEETWAMQIEFQSPTGGRRVAVIDWYEFMRLRESSKNE